jgi:FKBP-type peptidyl-prolyl cis-trans isomerase FkpA
MKESSINTISLFFVSILLITLVSCDPTKKYKDDEQALIQQYLNTNPTLNFELKPSGLYYLEELTGTGLNPVLNDSVFVKFSVQFLDGTFFYENPQKVIDTIILVDKHTNPYNYTIPGFLEGITSMKEGGKSKFLLPSELAYGPDGSYPYIPGYTPLLFNTELVTVRRGSAK